MVKRMISAILFAVFLLAVGVSLRVTLKPLQWIFVPASIVGGLFGLALIQMTGNQNHAALTQLQSWPGMLIAVVFACMFLDRGSRSLRQSLGLAGREGIVVWIVVLGQTAVGLLCTWLLIQPWFDVPNSFGMLIETGFAGGHGTAAAMGAVFESENVGLADGLDLGLFMATVGLVFSVISGVVYVNLAIRLGWLGNKERIDLIQGLENRGAPEPVAKGTVRSEVVDPLVFQLLIVGAAFGLGYAMKESVTSITQSMGPAAVETGVASDQAVEANVENAAAAKADQEFTKRASLAGTVGDFPLFIYALLGGLIVRQLMHFAGIDDLIDRLSIQRISGVAMEFLIVSAITTLRIESIAGVAGPLAILLVAAFAWTGFCLLFVSRRLLPGAYWFQLGILNYGMSTGTTATGFTLLKIVDKDLSSGAAEDYALAAPLSSPFVGGGLLTIGLPLLVLEEIPIAVSACGLTAVVIGLFFLGRFLARSASA